MSAQIRQNIYDAWVDGEVSAVEALRALCHDYEELDDTYKQFEAMREHTREQIGNVLVRLDGKAEIKGFGTLTISAPVVVEGFDKKALTALVDALAQEGNVEMVQRIAACRTRTSRAGGLRIEREK